MNILQAYLQYCNDKAGLTGDIFWQQLKATVEMIYANVVNTAGQNTYVYQRNAFVL